MDSFKTIWMNVPRKIYDITEKLNISKDYVGGVCKDVYNYVEDRFIDYTVHKNAPGYRGYYGFASYRFGKPVRYIVGCLILIIIRFVFRLQYLQPLTLSSSFYEIRADCYN